MMILAGSCRHLAVTNHGYRGTASTSGLSISARGVVDSTWRATIVPVDSETRGGWA
jgi:hypothetical protein